MSHFINSSLLPFLPIIRENSNINQFLQCWTQLITPAGLRFGLIDQAPDYPGLGIALLVISAFLKIAWFAPYVQMGMFTYRRDRGWRAPQSCKNIMQADEDAFSVAPPRTPNDILYEDSMLSRCSNPTHITLTTT